MHSVGFEPTSTNTFELESNPLDRSGKNAEITNIVTIYIYVRYDNVLTIALTLSIQINILYQFQIRHRFGNILNKPN